MHTILKRLWETKFPLIFRYRRGICMLNTSYMFHNLMSLSSVKSIYVITLRKRLVLDHMGPGDISARCTRLHKLRLQSKTSTNSLLLSIGPAHWRSHLIMLNASVLSKANRNDNHCTILSTLGTVYRCGSLSDTKNVCFDVFGLTLEPQAGKFYPRTTVFIWLNNILFHCIMPLSSQTSV